MIVLTPEAASAVKTAMQRAGRPSAGLRVGVAAGGCAGYKYSIRLDDEPEIDDLIFESGDVRVFVDADSQQLARGLTIDFVEDHRGPGFTFDNPNATLPCSCAMVTG